MNSSLQMTSSCHQAYHNCRVTRCERIVDNRLVFDEWMNEWDGRGIIELFYFFLLLYYFLQGKVFFPHNTQFKNINQKQYNQKIKKKSKKINFTFNKFYFIYRFSLTLHNNNNNNNKRLYSSSSSFFFNYY